MSDNSRRYLLIQAIAARLSVIQVANGYNTDAGLQIFLGEIPMFGDDDPPDAIALIVGSDIVRNQGENVVSDVPIEVQALVKAGISSPLLALENMVQDIKRAVELPDLTFGGLLIRRGFVRKQVRVLEREPGSNYGGVGVGYEATIAEPWGHP